MATTSKTAKERIPLGQRWFCVQSVTWGNDDVVFSQRPWAKSVTVEHVKVDVTGLPPFELPLHRGYILKFQLLSHLDIGDTSLNFLAGWEFHEARGPVFLKGSNCFYLEVEKTENDVDIKTPQKTSCIHVLLKLRLYPMFEQVAMILNLRWNAGKRQDALPRAMKLSRTLWARCSDG